MLLFLSLQLAGAAPASKSQKAKVVSTSASEKHPSAERGGIGKKAPVESVSHGRPQGSKRSTRPAEERHPSAERGGIGKKAPVESVSHGRPQGSKRSTRPAEERRPSAERGGIGKKAPVESVSHGRPQGSKRSTRPAEERRPSAERGGIGKKAPVESVSHGRPQGSKRSTRPAEERRPSAERGGIGKKAPVESVSHGRPQGSKRSTRPAEERRPSAERGGIGKKAPVESVSHGRPRGGKVVSRTVPQRSETGSSKSRQPRERNSFVNAIALWPLSWTLPVAINSSLPQRDLGSPKTARRTPSFKTPSHSIQGSVGGFGNIYSSGYRDGGNYQDGGAGISLGIRVAKVVGLEVSASQHTDGVGLAKRERSNSPVQLVGQISLLPRSTIRPFVSAGYGWNNISIDDTLPGTKLTQINHQQRLNGPVAGIGIELMVGDHIGFTAEWRHLWYSNVEQGAEILDHGDLISAGVGFYF